MEDETDIMDEIVWDAPSDFTTAEFVRCMQQIVDSTEQLCR